MSDFDTLQASVEGSRPIELYRFSIGTASYLFTSSEDDVTFGGETFVATSIARDAIRFGIEDRAQPFAVTVPSDNAFSALYRAIVPSFRATLTVMRLQRDETPSLTSTVIFKGFVKSVEFSQDGTAAKVLAQTRDASGSHQIPRRTFQGLCSHQLYDSNCGVDPTGHKFSGVVTAQSGDTITVTALGGSGMDFIAGYCKPAAISDFRMVMGQSGDVLTLIRPFGIDLLGQVLEVFEGCDRHLTGDCLNRYDNIINFGGFAFIPTKDIFATGLD